MSRVHQIPVPVPIIGNFGLSGSTIIIQDPDPKNYDNDLTTVRVR
jgi:hypothetical protein